MPDSNALSEYRTLGPLQARIDTHRRYSEHPDDVEGTVLEALSLDPADSLLDVGCGTGSFLARLREQGHVGRLAGLDTSQAAVDAAAAVERVKAVRADAMRMPFADGEFSVVCARHMLYHVQDPSQAIREAWRVLAPDGTFLAVVNLPDALPETRDLLRTVVARHGVQVPPEHERPLHAESLPALIEPVFGDVQTTTYPNALVYPTAEAFARYGIAMLSFYGVEEDSPVRDAAVSDLVAEATRRFAASGASLRERKGFSISIAHR